MVESLQINKIQVKEKLIVDSLAIMSNTEDFDFSPRAKINGLELIFTSACLLYTSPSPRDRG